MSISIYKGESEVQSAGDGGGKPAAKRKSYNSKRSAGERKPKSTKSDYAKKKRKQRDKKK